MRIRVLVGNPKAHSRTRQAAEKVAQQLARAADTVETTDLTDYASELFDWNAERVNTLVADVAASDLLIVASPTFKATYTGLLKAFLDRYQSQGLQGVVAVPLMTANDKGHQLASDTHLRPLLVELGASVPTASIFVETPKIDSFDEQLDEWLQNNTRYLPID